MAREDGHQIAARIEPELDYLSGISRRLGARDLVEEYFQPVVGKWADLHAEAERWRRAGLVAEHVTRDLTKPLGKLDSAWQGADAESFVRHMQQVGLAGHDLSDAMNVMGDALDATADGVRGAVEEMASLFADAAEAVSAAAALPVDGDRRVLQHLEELRDPARELHESVRDMLEGFLRLCDSVSGEGEDGFAEVRMDHRFPEQDWKSSTPAEKKAVPDAEEARKEAGKAAEKPAEPLAEAGTQKASSGGGGAVGAGSGGGGGGGSVSGLGGGGGGSVPLGPAPGSGGSQGQLQPGGYSAVTEQGGGAATRTAAAAGAGGAGAAGGAGGMGMMGGGMMGGAPGGQQGGEKEHKSKFRLTGTIEEVYGKPKRSAPPVLGED
ncbi:WXG100 family type VII secretion target [Actinosynnema mirum]|uniref:WXG100 family type VII secretion target n=1 Tax=Actinosynnema mirum (strain ATCC 29888 / DSM 43827 / JCM 3225 / NBRC 14064 / NCIMB 13271 / NRRL B-12336 / IMRU 3971 / 101) TaxID=446462 RepID=C6WLY8_ACTMD|nr:hypothetical protein [Actinosynnema mirum]ACU40373.1 hypothetical protein Amir_6574 [Actinosynnema mirum DSM 43827]